MRAFLIGVGLLHAGFMLVEMVPWSYPALLRRASKQLSGEHQWTPAQQRLVATIVRNAGIYNAVIAGGLFWAAWAGDSARNVAQAFLVGAAVAGIFGAATLRSWVPALQGLLGVVGAAIIR
jgi:uncharacterized membrane protein